MHSFQVGPTKGSLAYLSHSLLQNEFCQIIIFVKSISIQMNRHSVDNSRHLHIGLWLFAAADQNPTFIGHIVLAF